MLIDICERIAGKQDGPGPIIYGIVKNAKKIYDGIYMKVGSYFFPYYICDIFGVIMFGCSLMQPLSTRG